MRPGAAATGSITCYVDPAGGTGTGSLGAGPDNTSSPDPAVASTATQVSATVLLVVTVAGTFTLAVNNNDATHAGTALASTPTSGGAGCTGYTAVKVA